MMLQDGDKIGPYTIRESAGQGGMATVYKAWHEGLHRFEALKVPKGAGSSDPDSAFILRLLTEARVAAGLHHPNIVGIHSVSEPLAPIPYFAMDWVEGRDLAKILGEKRAFSIGETTAILEKVAAALDYAHQKGVVHRDIKPANILITDVDGALVPQVVDFGISRAAEDEDGATKLTKSGMIVGTPEYMSPEQAGSGEAVDFRTDIYSLAVVAYEMLCGGPPFTAGSGVSRLSILIAHVRDIAPLYQKIPDFPREAGDVLLRALSKSPADRQQSCLSFVSQLRVAAGPHDRVFALERGDERTPFDSSRFDPNDDATIYERPGAALGTIPAQPSGAETAINAAEAQYSLQARLAAVQATPPVLESALIVTPKARLLEPSAPVPVVAPAIVAEPSPKPSRPKSNSRVTLMAGVGGIIVGALLVASLTNRNFEPPAKAVAATPTKVAATAKPFAPPALNTFPTAKPAVVGSAPAGQPRLRTVLKTERRPVDFKTVTRRSDSRPAGSTYVAQNGSKGLREVVFSLTYQGEKEMARKVVSDETVRQPEVRIIVVGTREAAPEPRRRPVRVERPRVERERSEPRRRPARVSRPSRPRPAPRAKKRRTVREAPLPP
ncbi:hypothetical protein EON80_10170 [bacterium]|nr:MAG: hypothetical protein EON80_10170 [bacterium]